jgi:hypothetical protein
MVIRLVSTNLLHHEEVVTFLITQCIHVLCNYISHVLLTTPVRELDVICSGNSDRVGACLPPHRAIKVTIMPGYLPGLDLVPNGQLHSRTNIWIASVHIMFLNIINVRCHSMAIKIITIHENRGSYLHNYYKYLTYIAISN